MNRKSVYVAFADKRLESKFESLKKGRFHDKRLYELIEKAVKDIKKYPMSSIKIQKKIWPKIYIKKYGINNLWKYNLPDGWRIIYTIKTNEVMILNIILEWLNHKEYEKRFRY